MDVLGGFSRDVEQNIKGLEGEKSETIMLKMQKAILRSSLHKKIIINIARTFKLSFLGSSNKLPFT